MVLTNLKLEDISILKFIFYNNKLYRMHGETIDGNEPFILLYNPKLNPKNEIKIDVIDVAPTLSMYLKNVDIPANSMGIAQPYYGNFMKII